MRRHSKEIQEALPKTSETWEVEKFHEGPVVLSETSSQLHRNDRAKEIISQQEEGGFKVKNKLNVENLEITKLRKASRKTCNQGSSF